MKDADPDPGGKKVEITPYFVVKAKFYILTNIVGCVAGCLKGVSSQGLLGKPEVCQFEDASDVCNKSKIQPQYLLDPVCALICFCNSFEQKEETAHVQNFRKLI